MLYRKLLTTVAAAALTATVIGTNAVADDAQKVVKDSHLYKNSQVRPHAEPREQSVNSDARLKNKNVYSSSQADANAEPRDGAVAPSKDIQKPNVYKNAQPYPYKNPAGGALDKNRNSIKSGDKATLEEAPSWDKSMRLVQKKRLGPVTSGTVIIDGKKFAETEVIGRPVVTPTGTRFGVIKNVRQVGPAEETLIILIDKEHREPLTGMKNAGDKKSKDLPVISGDGTAAVNTAKVRSASESRSFVVEKRSLRPIDG